MVHPHPNANGRLRPAVRPRSWVLSCGIGEFLGMGIAGTTMFLVNRWLGTAPDDDARMLALSIMLLAGVAEGGLIGYFQWRVLRKLLPGMTAKSWIGITILAAVVGWGMGMMPAGLIEQSATEATPEPLGWQMLLGGIGMGLVLGALFGLFQNMVLKHFVANQWQWTLYNALGWAVAMGWIFLAATSVGPEWPVAAVIATATVAGGLAGISLGLITGVFWQRKGVY